MLLPMSPDVLHRIESRGSGQKFDLNLPVACFDEIFDQTATVTAQAIPDNEKIAANLAHRLRLEFHNLRTPDRSWKQPEIKRQPCNPRNCRNGFPIELEPLRRLIADFGHQAVPYKVLLRRKIENHIHFVMADDPAMRACIFVQFKVLRLA